MTNHLFSSLAASLLLAGLVASPQHAAAKPSAGNSATVTHNTVTLNGVDVFYREAGDRRNPTILLLHGFPSSSHMFRDLIPQLAPEFHVIAPDYPGFGQSAMPDSKTFVYTFDNLGKVVEDLTVTLKLDSYALYVMDYGAPVGYRLAVRHPEKVTALVVQNGNAYEEGLGEFWAPLRAYWADGSTEHRDALRQFLTLDGTKWQYTNGTRHAESISPDAWTLDQWYLERPGNKDIQLDLFYDYRTNLTHYPAWQQYFREHQPPTLIVWGRNDVIFPPSGAYPYLKDLPNAEFHLLNTGHFALEEDSPLIGTLMIDFLQRSIPRNQ